jgi:hypothetical protein
VPSRALPITLISSCTNRKKFQVEARLEARSLKASKLATASKEWLTTLDQSITNGVAQVSADELYCGRSFTEAAKAAIGANHYIVSAGLGLIHSKTKIPAYSLTITGDTSDNISRKVSDFEATKWWRTLERSPFASTTLADVCMRSNIVVLALPSNYLELVKSVLLELTPKNLKKLRIVGVSKSALHPDITEFAMPIDARLDGPDSKLRGTKTDFAVRAARTLMEQTISRFPNDSASDHAGHIESVMKNWAYPAKINRRRLTDEEIVDEIATHWDLVGGKSGEMLRHLRRNLGLACEQGRFRKLFNELKLEKEGHQK